MNVSFKNRGRPLTTRDRLAVDLLYWPAVLSLRLGRTALTWCLRAGLTA